MFNIPSTLSMHKHSACHWNIDVIPHSLYLSSTADGKPQDDNSRLSADDQLWESVGLATLHAEKNTKQKTSFTLTATCFVLSTIYLVEAEVWSSESKRTWREVVQDDCQARNMNKGDAMDRCKWRKMIKDVRCSGWVWVGECFFWYRPTQVVPDKSC